MDFIELNGVGLRYELSGKGDRTVVLVHEMGGSLESWDDVAPQLAESRRVLRYDTRGAGLSQKARGELSLDTMADDIAALLDHSGIAGKVALAGIAVGGAIALRTALAHPDQVERLVLVDPGLPAWDWTEGIRGYWAEEERLFEAGDIDGAVEVNMEFWVKPEHRNEVRPQQRHAFELQSAHEEPELIWPEMASLSTLTMPTLVVLGEDDYADFLAIGEHLASEIPDAELVVVPGAGHLVGIDQPEELNALLLEFLSD